jgi:hypothetical protein
VDVHIEASAETLTKVYMGWLDFPDGLASKASVFMAHNNMSLSLING